MSARPHFSVAGIPVRVEPVFLVISALFGLRYVDFGIEVVGIWMAATFVSILVHELGHGFALKFFGQGSVIVLHGFGGVTISSRRASLSRARSIVVSLAGAASALVLLWLPARSVLGAEWISDKPVNLIWFVLFLAFQNLWWSVANLLPIRPLDGGNVTAELFGLARARRISVGVAVGAAVWAFLTGYGYAAFFALFLAFNNWQEIRAEQVGADMNAFDVEAPDEGRASPRRRGRARLSVVAPELAVATPADDFARAEPRAWSALRVGDVATAKRLEASLGESANPYLRASVALAAGDDDAFKLFEDAYVAVPSGPPSLVATELLARSGAAIAVARRLAERKEPAGREGAGSLQTHLHYAGRFTEAAEVGEVVFAANPPSRAQTAFEVACSWARAGEVDKSAEWLESAADAGFKAASVVDGEPDLGSVRSDPRWPLLRARLT